MRFSLRGFFLLLSFFLCFLGWIVNETRKQSVAIAALTKLSCKCNGIAFTPPHFSIWAKLRHFLGDEYWTDVLVVKAAGTPVRDSDCRQYLASLTELQLLDLSNTGITDSGIKQLSSLAKLKCLCLRGVNLTDDGMACFEGLSDLRELDLSETQITDAGIMHLKHLPPLINTTRPCFDPSYSRWSRISFRISIS